MAIWSAFVGLLENVLLTFYSWTGSAGLAIILFTIIARLIILPLTLKSLQSNRKMQELQPQIKELQRKYGKEPQRLSEETMKLYKEYKVNPAGGCLPMILQFPIFIGVYQAVINLTPSGIGARLAEPILGVLAANGLSHASALSQTLTQNQLAGGFLWLRDLGTPDPYYVLPVLSVVCQLIVQLMAMPRVQDPQQKAMSQSMLVLPLVFGYIGFVWPSGAVLYWVVGSFFSMIQQYIISGWGSLANYLKFLPADRGRFKSPTPALAGAGAGSSAGTSSVAQAVESPPEEAQKVSFWDVLRPLIDEEGGTAEQSGFSTEEGAGSEASDPVRRSANQMNPRRRKRR
ncbi:MAG TPA: YidC/Oxa1 family membrane protein insertase [Roseiflexaceae bacterium]|jgi:YidC/Oxa1 family membrane protein insertase|nr:YidC/Oxa1 family membrane protein insertase [Roseiflexaceae bacterium]